MLILYLSILKETLKFFQKLSKTFFTENLKLLDL